MKRLLLLPLILLTINAFSQYHPTAVKGRQWNQFYISTWFPPGVQENLKVGEDTLINGQNFFQINSIDELGNITDTKFLIQEDTVKPSIRLRYPGVNTSDMDMYLDFSIPIGDSIIFQCDGFDTLYAVLDSIGTFTDLINTNRPHYFYHINSQFMGSQSLHFSWIEGLGAFSLAWGAYYNPYHGGIYNLFSPMNCATDIPLPILICVQDSNASKLIDNPQFTNCHYDIGLAENPLSAAKVFPNPFIDFLALEGLPAQKSVHLQLIAPTGEIVMELPLEESTRIDLSALNSGIYILHVKSDGYVKSFKVVKE